MKISPVIARLSAMLLISLGALLLPMSLGATESEITRLDRLINKCIGLLEDDVIKNKDAAGASKDAADACERVTNTIRTRTELHQKSVDVQRAMQERGRWESFGWPSLVILNLLLIIIVGAIIAITKSNFPELLQDPERKVSFSRVIGLLGVSAIFIASAVLLNVLLAHLFIFKAVPEGIVSLFAPILTFIPTLLPYIFAKRAEGSVAIEKVRSGRSSSECQG